MLKEAIFNYQTTEDSSQSKYLYCVRDRNKLRANFLFGKFPDKYLNSPELIVQVNNITNERYD